MLKKLCLFTIFALLPLFSQTLDLPTQITHILDHIEGAKRDIMLEMKLALSLKEKAEKHLQNLLLNNYESAKGACLQLLRDIALSPEFIATVEQVTNDQLDLIVNNLVNYNDIIIDPSFYPLEQKVKNELALAGFDAQKEQMFNVFYVVYSMVRGSQTLLRKLKIKEKELTAELQELQALDQTVLS